MGLPKRKISIVRFKVIWPSVLRGLNIIVWKITVILSELSTFSLGNILMMDLKIYI